jgi:hypothetical protein
MSEEVQVERSVCRLAYRRDLLADGRCGQCCTADRTQATGVANRRSSAGVVNPLIGACTIGWVIPSSLRKSVHGHMIAIRRLYDAPIGL